MDYHKLFWIHIYKTPNHQTRKYLKIYFTFTLTYHHIIYRHPHFPQNQDGIDTHNHHTCYHKLNYLRKPHHLLHIHQYQCSCIHHLWIPHSKNSCILPIRKREKKCPNQLVLFTWCCWLYFIFFCLIDFWEKNDYLQSENLGNYKRKKNWCPITLLPPQNF